ncbi:MAG: lipocalin-like domain-containing protein, partial [Thermomicrobiales bacterium]
MSARRFWATVLRTSYFVLLLLLVACGQPVASDSGKAAWPGPFTVPMPAQTQSVPPPITFPRDEAPHNDLTEWWYYTGHLQAADGTAYGF